MKAIRINAFGGPEVLKLEELPDPAPAAGQVVVRAEAIGVNPVDTYLRSGKYGPKQFPYIPGTDAAGLIESVGPNVTNIKIGQRVYVYGSINGAYAQRLLCTSQQVHPLPTRLSFEQGAAIGVPYGTAYRAIFIRGQAKPAETILIHGGSGGVGTAAIQLAKNLGMMIIATAGTEKGLESVLKQGADYALNHHDADYMQRAMTITGNRGVDMIIELLANVNLNKDLGILAKRGRVVVVGNRGTIEIDPRQTMVKDSDIRGMSLMHADEAELAMIHAGLGAGFANGSLTPVLGRQFPLADAAKAHEAILEPGAHGKIVLIP
jgi:NADPH:quinone reductase